MQSCVVQRLKVNVRNKLRIVDVGANATEMDRNLLEMNGVPSRYLKYLSKVLPGGLGPIQKVFPSIPEVLPYDVCAQSHMCQPDPGTFHWKILLFIV